MASAAAGVLGAPAAAAPVDCIRAISNYIKLMLNNALCKGMKTLLLDKETKTMVSMVMSMNDILSRQVFLIESLESMHTAKTHMKAVVFVRPTHENMSLLKEHLASPKYLEYHIFFTNVVPHAALQDLADKDNKGVVKQVQEYFADYYAVNPDLFTLNLGFSLSLCREPSRESGFSSFDRALLERAKQGLLALALSMKVKPHIRHIAGSEAARQLAANLNATIDADKPLFEFKSPRPLLLILDRREDPLTPLLMPWTYQAMIHELAAKGGIVNNTVDMKGVPKQPAGFEEIVLSATEDDFFKRHMHSGMPEFGPAASAIIDELQATNASYKGKKWEIEDMAEFMEKFPEQRAKASSVSKHGSLASFVTETSHARRLFELSEIEQEIAMNDDAEGQARMVAALFDGTSSGAGAGAPPPAPLDAADALRLVAAFTLRYEKSKPAKVSEVRRLVQAKVPGMTTAALEIVDSLVRFAGQGSRHADLFGSNAAAPSGAAGGGGGWSVGGMMARTAAAMSAVVRGGAEEERETLTLMRHTPQLVSFLQDIARGTLKAALFPYSGTDPGPGTKFKTVIVFVIGGATYSEAAKVAAINSGALPLVEGPAAAAAAAAAGGNPNPFRVILGGTSILNSTRFFTEISKLAGGGVETMSSAAGGAGGGAFAIYMSGGGGGFRGGAGGGGF